MQSKIDYVIKHEELQKQKIREQPGFVRPSRVGANQSERLAMETKELTAARLARFSANHSKRLVMETELTLSCELSHSFPYHSEHDLTRAHAHPKPCPACR